MPIVFCRPDIIIPSGLPAAVLSADPGVWEMVFEDNFDTFDYDNWGKAGEAHPTTGDVWTDLYGDLPGGGKAMTGWDPSNVYVSGGQLHLRVTGSGNVWTGGMVHQRSLPGRGWKYGYFEARVLHPVAVQNAFTAPLWAMPQVPQQYWSTAPYGFNSPWPASGEIDAWECFMNNLPDEGEIIYSNLIFLKNSQYTNVGGQNTYREPGIPLSSAYRDIGFHWFEDPNNSGKITIRMLHNGAYYGPGITQDSFGGELSATAPFDQPFQLCMGIHGGIGWGSIDAGNGPGWPGDAWHGSEILVDRVRVYQRVG